MFTEYLRLLIKRESKEVLGRNYANMWLLAIVLTATFISIAFSNGSMKYLSEKMNDPFTNWVSISKTFNESDFDGLRRALDDEEVQRRYQFGDVQSDNYMAYTFVGRDRSLHYLQGRFFNNLDSKLVRAILDDNNVIASSAVDFDKLNDRAFGFIITGDVLHKLGYDEKHIPAYIDYLRLSSGADTLGVEMIESDRAALPMPLLGVVKRLPGNMDLISSRFFLEQDQDNIRHPLNLNNPEYLATLTYFLPETVADSTFECAVAKVVPDSLAGAYKILPDPKKELQTWKPGHVVSVFFDSYELPVKVYQDMAVELGRELGPDVVRLYNYNTGEFTLSNSQYISVNFNSLDSIRAFESFANDNYRVKIEMTQVNAKENFNAVSVMANILSWAMITFSLVCIIMFIVNMLQSYFQKVRRNLGTFKAFGIDSGELIKVYVFILVCIIIAAIVIALGVSWLVELLLPVLGVLKDGQFNYLSLWSVKTLCAVAIVLVATIVTVRIVMRRMLRRTPGDLIYDRD